MNDYTDLVADARVWPRDGVSKGPLINALADAIEALVKGSAKLPENSEVADLERERDALAAEVERLKLVHVGQARLAMLAVYLADVDGDEGTQAFYREWVRAHDRQVAERAWDEGWAAAGAWEIAAPGAPYPWNPYRKEQENTNA